MDSLLTTSQLAERTGLSTATIRRWAADGWLPVAMKTRGGYYRFDLDAVLARLKDHLPHPHEET